VLFSGKKKVETFERLFSMQATPQYADDDRQPAEPFHAATAGSSETELDSLMSAVKQQALDVSCEFSRLSEVSALFGLLSSRIATLQPQVSRLIAEKAALEGELAQAIRARESADQRLADVDAELKHYRPIANKLDDELRVANTKLQRANSQISLFEGQISKMQGEENELTRKLCTAETEVVRFKEENQSIRQKALEQATLIQGLLREAAELKSLSSSAVADSERQEQRVLLLTEKLVAEKDTATKAAAQVTALELRHAHAIRELQMRLTEAEEREQTLISTLTTRDKDLYDRDIRHSGASSKIDFLTRLNDRLRDDMRRHVDHAAMLEASNKQLLETLSAKAQSDDSRDRDRMAQHAPPTLRAVGAAE
jgi:chromosome segregation ATPase